MELSVIVVAYNAAEYLPACLRSLKRWLDGIEHEVCLVDNASTDGGPELALAVLPGLTLIRNPRNAGFSAGVNAGLAATSGRFALWLNPDAELSNGGMRGALKAFDDPAVGVVGPLVRGADGRVQLSCRSFPSLRTALFNRQSLLTRFLPGNPFSRRYLRTDLDRSRPAPVDWVSGACLLHRRELGGLDERFFLYCEDVDFCLRARRAGWTVLYHPALEARHWGAGSSRREPVRAVWEHHRSMWAYYAKHFPRHPLKDAAVGAAIGGRCALRAVGSALGGGWR